MCRAKFLFIFSVRMLKNHIFCDHIAQLSERSNFRSLNPKNFRSKGQIELKKRWIAEAERKKINFLSWRMKQYIYRAQLWTFPSRVQMFDIPRKRSVILHLWCDYFVISLQACTVHCSHHCWDLGPRRCLEVKRCYAFPMETVERIRKKSVDPAWNRKSVYMLQRILL